MTIPVKLSDIVVGMDVPDEDWTVYLNRRTGELVTVTPEDDRLLDDPSAQETAPDWQLEQLPKIREALQSHDYLALPGKWDIHEWSIMEHFVRSIDDQKQRATLEHAIHGRGAFGRFKDAVHEAGLQQDWLRFRDGALEDIAATWLKENDVPFERDRPGPAGPDG